MTENLRDQVVKYLTDAHSIETQALAQLRTAPDLTQDPEIARIFEEHERETEGHERTIRELLDSYDASPSSLKESVMALGGKGFVLFARSQRDTSGKLMSHAHSYEALEEASYELLMRVAEQAGEERVVEAANRIREDERRMEERIAGNFDRSVEESLRDVPRDDLDEQLNKYLADAHAVEGQAIELLERAPKIVDDPELGRIFEEHLAETREHQELVRERLDARGGSPSMLQDLAMRTGALGWGSFFQAHPDTPGKLAAFAYAFEHLEVGGYEQLKRFAERVGDVETARMAERILEQEREAAQRISAQFDRAASGSLEAVGVR
jgi:ferritin-like metal-binding protein YciE